MGSINFTSCRVTVMLSLGRTTSSCFDPEGRCGYAKFYLDQTTIFISVHQLALEP